MSVYSFDEWSQLKEIVIGRAENARIPSRDIPSLHFEGIYSTKRANYPIPTFPKRVIEETKEDLAELAKVLNKIGIIVKRPDELDTQKIQKTFHWETDCRHVYCPRDIALVVGSRIIEAPMVFRSRQNEIEGYKQIFLDYFKEGASWVSCPRPCLTDEMYSLDRRKGNRLNNLEPVFDAANILRAGKDLFYLISESGNELGADWLQSILGDKYRVHKCFNLYDSIHIDTTISLLKPGLALINPARVRKENLPKALRKWKIIPCPEMIDIGSEISPPISSVWIGMNLLMVNPSLAIVEKNQVALIKLLEGHNIDVIPLSLRHARALGGGFHCVTLDTKREAGYEDYFN